MPHGQEAACSHGGVQEKKNASDSVQPAGSVTESWIVAVPAVVQWKTVASALGSSNVPLLALQSISSSSPSSSIAETSTLAVPPTGADVGAAKKNWISGQTLMIDMTWQLASQLSKFGWSQVSPGCSRSSPQTTGIDWQPSSHRMSSGGSQSSPGCTISLPQTMGMSVHVASQVTSLGGSQSSPGCSMPFPQATGIAWHSASHRMPSGGSQSSPGCSSSSPHTGFGAIPPSPPTELVPPGECGAIPGAPPPPKPPPPRSPASPPLPQAVSEPPSSSTRATRPRDRDTMPQAKQDPGQPSAPPGPSEEPPERQPQAGARPILGSRLRI